MRLPKTGLFAGFLLFLFTTTALGQDSLQTAEVNEILAQYGVRENVENMTGTIRTQFQSNPLGLAPNIHEKIMTDMEQSYHPDSLMKFIRAEMLDQYNDEKVTRVTEWLNGDLAQKFTELEQLMSTVEGYRLRVVRWYEMDQDPPSVVRITIIDELNDATGTVEMVVDTFSGFFRGYLNRASANNTEQAFTQSQINGFVDNYRARVRSDIQGQLREQQLVTYAELPNEELNTYVDFFETEAGSWLTDTILTSVNSALKSAGSNISDS